MADRERARCRVAHLGHERGNSRSTNSQNAKSARPLIGNGPSRRGHWLGPLFLKVRVGGRRSPARTIQAALSAAMLQITISHNSEFVCRAFYSRCRLTVVQARRFTLAGLFASQRPSSLAGNPAGYWRPAARRPCRRSVIQDRKSGRGRATYRPRWPAILRCASTGSLSRTQ